MTLETDKRMTFPNPMLVVVSGPSGVGKSTIVAEMARRRPQVVPIVTATTRPRRPDEIDGVHYHFLTAEAFEELIARDGLLEHANNHGYWYGTPIDQVRGILAAGRDAILTISPEGARNVRRQVPDALLIFVMPPSMEDLAERLLGRGSETMASLERRRRDAERWIAESDDYDHVVVNETGHPEQAAERIWDIIQAEARRDPPRRPRV
ncbi:MAG TPA: guanylate kinase [Candidatus Limnocylindrales bacterium]|jgi:guanylate kinase|nr:guanylate kinase [Candidatus Limnocylindrales bacterium]